MNSFKMFFLEYIWVDTQGHARSKLRTVWARTALFDDVEFPCSVNELSDEIKNLIPVWNFDGSSTGQNHGISTEVLLIPVKVYRSPLNGDNFLVLCELEINSHNRQGGLAQAPDPRPEFNTRRWASAIATRHADKESWFGLEQEYMLLDAQTDLPYNWQESTGEAQGPYYCSTRYPYCQLDEMVRRHYQLCALTGIKIAGINVEVAPSQWEFQIGPGDLLQVADDLVMARYLLGRLSNEYRVKVTYHPKPRAGDWNGSGCHINFSTNATRNSDGGYRALMEAAKRMDERHLATLPAYGKYNNLRLTGKHETSSMSRFTWGIGTRNTSMRIPESVFAAQCGYLEDRRPAANIDPYLATATLLETICGNSSVKAVDSASIEHAKAVDEMRGIARNIVADRGVECPWH